MFLVSAFYITNGYLTVLPGNAGALARICGGRGRPRSQSWLQSYELIMKKRSFFINNFVFVGHFFVVARIGGFL